MDNLEEWIMETNVSDVQAGIQFISEALEKQKIKPLIDKTFPIDKFREAFDYQLAAKNRRGKIVITVWVS